MVYPKESCCVKNGQVCLILSAIIFVIVGTLGLAIYSLILWVDRDTYPEGECGTFGNITSYTMNKDFSAWSNIWHWKYSSVNGNAYFVQRCPTFTHDADIYNNGKMVARTDGKIFSLLAKYYIRDCHGNEKYYVEAGDLFQQIINSNKIWVSMVIYFTNQTVHSYIESTIFVTGTVNIKDSSGNTIAHIDKSINNMLWQWNYMILQPNYINMDMLIAITSKLSFIPSFADKMFDVVANNNKGDDSSKTDVCNSLFANGGITSLTLICIAVVCGIVYLLHKHCPCTRKYFDWCGRNCACNSQCCGDCDCHETSIMTQDTDYLSFSNQGSISAEKL